jgi:hypothetical protein
VREQSFFKITRNTCIADGFVCLADQDINVKELFHRLACQAVVFGVPVEKVKCTARLRLIRRGSPESFRGWARQDSNLGPRDYESPALTAELQARHKSGCYYARTFKNNKEIWKSLRTAHFSVAKARLAEFLREQRGSRLTV